MRITRTTKYRIITPKAYATCTQIWRSFFLKSLSLAFTPSARSSSLGVKPVVVTTATLVGLHRASSPKAPATRGRPSFFDGDRSLQKGWPYNLFERASNRLRTLFARASNALQRTSAGDGPELQPRSNGASTEVQRSFAGAPNKGVRPGLGRTL